MAESATPPAAFAASTPVHNRRVSALRRGVFITLAGFAVWAGLGWLMSAAGAQPAASPAPQTVPVKPALESAGAFFRWLYGQYAEKHLARRGGDFDALCKRHKLDCKTATAAAEYAAARFYFDLLAARGFTVPSGEGVTVGGCFALPYIDVPARGDIMKTIVTPDGVSYGNLSALKRQGARYLQIESTLEREPAIFLADLVDVTPLYLAGNERTRTFGAAPEFAASYVAILRELGLKARVVSPAAGRYGAAVDVGGKPLAVDLVYNAFGDEVARGGDGLGWLASKEIKRKLAWFNERAGEPLNFPVHAGAAAWMIKRVEQCNVAALPK